MNANHPDTEDIIKITADDAGSTHVDDLLKRHASLRGDRGITRDRGRKWYYQNWLVFMIVGCAGALVAFALLNPFYDEEFYAQGTITQIDVMPLKPIHFFELGHEGTIPPEHYVTMRVGEDSVVLTTRTRWRGPDGKFSNFNLDKLKKGERLGVYFMPDLGAEADTVYNIAHFVIPDPPPNRRDSVSLEKQLNQNKAAEHLLFPLIAALVGMFIAAADGIMCRQLRRVLLAGGVGLLIGFVGGFLSDTLGELVYSVIQPFAEKHGGALGFSLQTTGRGLAWVCCGMTMGLGQGIALRSKRLFIYGFLGGMIGGLLGGLLFDPIDRFIMGPDTISGQVSRWIGFGVIGATVGLMIGIVERLARDAWLRMVEGPLAGKEFLVFKDVMRMGSSPRSEIYLFNDKDVAAQHAVIRATGDIYEIENSCSENPVCLNGRPIKRSRLRHGDRISLGRTAFVFQRQRAE